MGEQSVSLPSMTAKEVRDPEGRYRRIVEAAEEGIITIDANALADFVNPKMARMLGYDVEQILGRPLTDFMDEEGRRLFVPYLQRLQQGVTQQFDFKVCCRQGEKLWVNVSANPLLDDRGEYVGALAMFTDIRERREAEHLLAWEKGALETIGGTATLGKVLEELMLGLERHLPDALCSVLLVDDDGLHLRHGAAPSLPTEYNRLVDGFPVGSSSGSCGTAVHTGQQVIVSDIASDPLWSQLRGEALSHGLRACWSTPVSDSKGKIIATFAVYYREPRRPHVRELQTIERAAHIACLAIERKRADEMLVASQKALRIANERLRLSNERLERRVNSRTQQLRALATELTHAEERERLRMADTMHEGLLQLLAATALRLESLRKQLGPKALNEALNDAQGLVEEAIKVGKSVIRDLYPPALHTLGLGEALRWLAQQHLAQGIEVEVEAPANFDVPEKELRITLFRAVHELLVNVRRHAGVKRASVKVSLAGEGFVRMVVSDSGVGFSPADIRAKEGFGGGFGLFSLRERIEALGGQVIIESAPGRGSCFLLTAPTAAGPTS
jgi:PAS domain S-box-containing protein